MEFMPIPVALGVTLPEMVLNIPLVLLLAGERQLLDLRDGQNRRKFLTALLLMALSSYMIRLVFPSIVFSVPVHIGVYALIIQNTYHMDSAKATVIVALLVSFLITIETLYIPLCATYIHESMASIHQSSLLRILYSIPERIAQLCAIISLWNFHIYYIVTKINPRFKLVFSAFFLILATFELLVGYGLMFHLAEAGEVLKVVYIMSLYLALLFNFIVLRTLHMVMVEVFLFGYKENWRLELETKELVSEVYNLLVCDKSERAKCLLKWWLDK